MEFYKVKQTAQNKLRLIDFLLLKIVLVNQCLRLLFYILSALRKRILVSVICRGGNCMHAQCLDLLIKHACFWAKTHTRLSWFLLRYNSIFLILWLHLFLAIVVHCECTEGVVKEKCSYTSSTFITGSFVNILCTHQLSFKIINILLFLFDLFLPLFLSCWSNLKKILCSTSFHSLIPQYVSNRHGIKP